eukprot:4257579-Pyramimonas_sp.AAC.1
MSRRELDKSAAQQTRIASRANLRARQLGVKSNYVATYLATDPRHLSSESISNVQGENGRWRRI